MFNIPPENHAVYETVWKNVVEGTDGNVTRRMRFACWTTTATNTHSEYVILIACLLQRVTRRAERVVDERDSCSAFFHFDPII